MAVPFWRRPFQADVMGISPKVAHSKFLRRKGATSRACMGKSSMRAEIRSWRTPMQTCQFHAEANLFLHRCIISCVLTGLTECMPDICPAIQHRTAACGCRNSMQLRSSMQWTSALQSRFLAGHQPARIWDNGDFHFSKAATDLQIHASHHVFLRLRFRGGADVTLTIVSARGLNAWQTGTSASRVNDWCWPSSGRGKDRQDRRGY